MLLYRVYCLYIDILHMNIRILQLNKRVYLKFDAYFFLFKVVVDNGIIQVTFSSPSGLITGIKYNGFNNVLNDKIQNRGYDRVIYTLIYMAFEKSIIKMSRLIYKYIGIGT